VVPVEVAFGSGTPLAWSARFLLWLLKSKPGIFVAVYMKSVIVKAGEERRRRVMDALEVDSW